MFLRNKVRELSLDVWQLEQENKYQEKRVSALVEKMKLLEEHLGIKFTRVEAQPSHFTLQTKETSKLK